MYKKKASLDTGEDTVYFCQLFKFPTEWTSKKRHLLRYETLFTPGNEKLVHHWTMNECSNEVEQVYANKSMPQPGPCMSYEQNDEWNLFKKHCKKISLVWAVGGSQVFILYFFKFLFFI